MLPDHVGVSALSWHNYVSGFVVLAVMLPLIDDAKKCKFHVNGVSGVNMSALLADI
jgi:hypothetical protein